MFRKILGSVLAKQKIKTLVNQNHFSRDLIPQIARLTRTNSNQIISQQISTHLKIMDCIKWLILLHHLALTPLKSNESQIEQLLQLVQPATQPCNIFETILFEKMIKPYKAYLLKRNKLNLKEMEPEIHCFALINMLKSALSFTNILYTLGRYLFKKNNFLVQFNLIIAKDLAYLYKTLKMNMNQDFHNQYFQTIELINQGMFRVYFNCYFNQYVSQYAPFWIEAGLNQRHSAKEVKSKIKIASKNCIKFERHNENIINEDILENNVSVSIEQSSINLKDQLKSTSTIASYRQSKIFYQANSLKRQKYERERREFILLAENILQSFKQVEEDDK